MRPIQTLWKKIALVCCVLALVSVPVAIKNTLFIPEASLDLALRHNAAILLSEHHNPYTFVLSETQEPARESYAPSVVAMMLPFASMSFDMTKWLWLGINMVATILILWVLFHLVGVKGGAGTSSYWPFVAAGAFFLASTPWRVVLGNGQFTLVAVAGALVSLYLVDKKHPVLCGFSLAIAMIKYPLTGLIPLVFLCKRQWLSVGVMLGVHGLLTLGVSYWLSENPVTLLWQSVASNQGNVGLGLADLGVFLGQYPWVYGVTALALLGVFAWGVMVHKERPWLGLFGITFLMTLLLSYHRIYDFAVLIVPLVYVLYAYRPSWIRTLWLVFIGLVFFVERLAIVFPNAYAVLQGVLVTLALVIFVTECFKQAPLSPNQTCI